jgi:hypothetical protein
MPFTPISEKKRQQIVTLLSTLGPTNITEISQKTNVSTSTVRRIAKKMGTSDVIKPSTSTESIDVHQDVEHIPTIEPLEMAPQDVPADNLPDFSGLDTTTGDAPPLISAAPPAMDVRPIVDVLCAVFDSTIVGRLGGAAGEPPKPPQPTTEAEREMLSAALAPIAQKYGSGAMPYMPEVTALCAIGAVFGVRLLQARAYAQYANSVGSSKGEAPIASGGVLETPEPASGPKDAEYQRVLDNLRAQMGGGS